MKLLAVFLVLLIVITVAYVIAWMANRPRGPKRWTPRSRGNKLLLEKRGREPILIQDNMGLLDDIEREEVYIRARHEARSREWVERG